MHRAPSFSPHLSSPSLTARLFSAAAILGLTVLSGTVLSGCAVEADRPEAAGSPSGSGDSGSSSGEASALGQSGSSDGNSPGTSGSGVDGSASEGGSNGSVGTGGSSATGGGSGTSADEPSPAPEGYPEGPYGTLNPQVGDVIENLSFEGYAHISIGTPVTDGTVSSFTLDDLRGGESRYLLIHVAAMWCPSCRTAANDLAKEADTLLGDGAEIIELVIDGTNNNEDPTDEQLASWANSSDLTVHTVRPSTNRGRTVFPGRDHAYIIDMTDMTVVWREAALFTDPSITELAIDALSPLLQ